ncbi:uncharacterized protein [Spinacia oleracea]|uniref:Aminotransferase-like plant mobile domain-containing protein n=1 Tax=Spinacia oleracea TaxID=3562 RepID=A0A9R0HR49_SPIOL|nr:uncharacterized protein LOC110775084 [Spinacia oleracea]
MDRLASFRARLDKLTPEEVLWTPFGANPSAQCSRTVYIGPICYRDIGEYNPDRVTRQLGYVQRIPRDVMFFGKAYRPPNFRQYEVDFHDLSYLEKWWNRFSTDGNYSSSLILTSLTPVPEGVPYMSTDNYMEWFFDVSHPHITPGFGETPVTAPIHDRSHTEYWVSRYERVIHALIQETNDPDNPMVVAAKQLMQDWKVVCDTQ